MDVPTYAQWRALVEKELKGADFDDVLVQATADGLALQPIYTEATQQPGEPGQMPYLRGATDRPPAFGVCMRVDPAAHRRPEALAEDLDGGADALWIDDGDFAAMREAFHRGVTVVAERDWSRPLPEIGRELDGLEDSRSVTWGPADFLAAAARGQIDPERLTKNEFWRVLVHQVENFSEAGNRPIRVSGLPYHDAGANVVDELALMLAALVTYLRPLVEYGVAHSKITRSFWFQTAVGRDTFGEVSKLRALRWLVGRLFEAGKIAASAEAVHAVCSAQTQTVRDPWVNMLRVSTQVFAAAIGGATLVTPRPFDDAFGVPSALGRRAARNAALVLREESFLGRVIDPAGGSYYLETRTADLAEEAWRRFQEIERFGGLPALLANGALRSRLDASWITRHEAIGKRKEPILGTSEFANVGETLPAPPPRAQPMPEPPALAVYRDSQGFEALRAPIEAMPPRVTLVTLGPAKEHRGRVGFAQNLFATVGLTPTESATPVRADIAVICGSDARYAEEAAGIAAQLKALGCRHVVLAGKPSEIANVDAFIYMGCDVLGTLAGLMA